VTDLAGWIPQTGAVGLLLAAVAMVLTGRIVARPLYLEARADRDRAQRAADTAIAANIEMSANVARLVGAVEQLTAAQRETLDLVRRLVPTAPTDRSAA
jgi:hypothetical protein